MARTPIHPGEILADELEELGITAAELGRILRVPAGRITQILNGQRGITAHTALHLGQWLGTGGEFWMNCKSLMSYGWRSRRSRKNWQPSRDDLWLRN